MVAATYRNLIAFVSFLSTSRAFHAWERPRIFQDVIALRYGTEALIFKDKSQPKPVFSQKTGILRQLNKDCPTGGSIT